MPVKAEERRRRRSSAEIRRLMLAAARECFAQEGYAGATTKEIARRADVAEALLFRTFTSKEKLFEAAVLQPFDDFLAAYTDRWMAREAPLGTAEEVLRQFVEELYDLALEHGQLFRAMSQADLLRAGAPPAFDRLEAMGEAIKQANDAQFDAHVAVRIAAVSVIATAHFGDALFPGTTGRQRIVDELVRMLVGATLYVPTDAARRSP
jgi:AcrR family transcriptional regulator